MPASRPLLKLVTVLLGFALLIAGCRAPQFGGEMSIHVTSDNETRTLRVSAGSTVLQALQEAGIAVGALDRADPPFYTVLADGDSLRLTRVVEEFQTEVIIVPFERQTVRNESLPEGETRLVQPGSNGQNEITYRRILEDGLETARTVVKTVVLQEAAP
ncbi:MAG TPA: G5 domain-containing protein, partial [Anaerolineales bacterium]